MKPERIERMLQDYLDGRLSADERAVFEDELRDDPRLSARVEEYRRIGDALREPAPELSPGFFTRTTARFEATRRKEPRWFRVLSWETAGLATAVVLVGAIFLPSLFRSDLAPLSQPPGAAPVDLAADASDRLEQAVGEVAALAKESSAVDTDETFADTPLGETLIEQKRSAETTRPSEIPVAGAEVLAEPPAAERRSQGPSAPPPPAAAPDEGTAAPDQREFAPVPRRQRLEADDMEPAEKQAPPLKSAATEAVELPTVAPRSDRERESSSAGYVRSDIGVHGSPPANLDDLDDGPADAIPLPAGFVEPGVVRQLTDPQAIERLLRKAGSATDRVASSSESLRLVLLGAWSPPFACADVRVGRSVTGYVVLLRPADGSVDADAGCAVALPDDALPVAVHMLHDE